MAPAPQGGDSRQILIAALPDVAAALRAAALTYQAQVERKLSRRGDQEWAGGPR